MLIDNRNTFFLMILLHFFLISSASADSERLELLWELAGLSAPESVVYDPQLKQLYVSNINGAANEKNGQGYISIVSLTGKMVQDKWITGLNAPKGLAIHGRVLYVADIDELVAIDINNGSTDQYPANDAKFLNDVTVTENGDVYVSDMMTNKIHRLSNDSFNVWLESEELESPNGLLAFGDDIILGSWGKMSDGFATDVPGHLKRISIKDKTITSIGDGSPVGNLDGVEADLDGDFYVTDWMNGKLFHIEHTGKVDLLLEFKQGSADHEFIVKQGLMLIPLMKENKLQAYKVHYQ